LSRGAIFCAHHLLGALSSCLRAIFYTRHLLEAAPCSRGAIFCARHVLGVAPSFVHARHLLCMRAICCAAHCYLFGSCHLLCMSAIFLVAAIFCACLPSSWQRIAIFLAAYCHLLSSCHCFGCQLLGWTTFWLDNFLAAIFLAAIFLAAPRHVFGSSLICFWHCPDMFLVAP
jgi:hypothetical protein